ncbi:MAG: hypothetical protein Q4P71_02705 [Actinomycetaceae bacterium]|nr:hypothetical protein [Actinomycetaceae bacterium]
MSTHAAWRYLRAEYLRSWRTFRMLLPVIILLCGFQAASISGGVAAQGGTGGLAQLHLYPAGIVIALGIITAIVTEYGDYRIRSGGLIYRAPRRWLLHSARLIVTLSYAFAGHLIMMLPVVAVAGASGWSLRYALVETAAFAGAYGVGLLLWAWIGRGSLLLGPIVGVAWSVAAVYQCESEQWYLNPFCWALRASLPICGVHANSVPVQPGDNPIPVDSLTPILLHLFIGLVSWALAVATMPIRVTPRGRQVARREVMVRGRGTSQVRALAMPLSWGVFCALAAVALVLILFIRMRYSISTAIGFWTLIVVPGLSVVWAVMVWQAHREAWRGLVLRPGRGRLFGTLLSLGVVPVVVIVVLGGVLSGSSFYPLVVAPWVAALVVVCVMVGAVGSLGLTMAGAILLEVWSLMAGASVLADAGHWWLTAPLAWGWTVNDYPERWFVAVCLCAVAAIGVGAFARLRMARYTGD